MSEHDDTVRIKVTETAAGVEDTLGGGNRAAQVAVGAVIGGAAGYLDATYVEPCGAALAASLLCLQLLEHEGVVSLPWNSSRRRHHHEAHDGTGSTLRAVGEEFKGFGADVAFVAAGFASGYLVARKLVE